MEQKLRNNGEMEYVLDLHDEKKLKLSIHILMFFHIFLLLLTKKTTYSIFHTFFLTYFCDTYIAE